VPRRIRSPRRLPSDRNLDARGKGRETVRWVRWSPNSSKENTAERVECRLGTRNWKETNLRRLGSRKDTRRSDKGCVTSAAAAGGGGPRRGSFGFVRRSGRRRGRM
jgi:hypothetical protein